MRRVIVVISLASFGGRIRSTPVADDAPSPLLLWL